MGQSTPKAFVDLAGATLVERAVAGVKAAGITRIVVAAPAHYTARATELLPGVTVVPGGSDRSTSVYQALTHIAHTNPPTYVLIHDAARCLTPPEVFHRVLASLVDGAHSVVPVVAVSDTIRVRCDDLGDKEAQPSHASTPTRYEFLTTPVDRSTLRSVQTPQGFAFAPLLAAHESLACGELTGPAPTDDASLTEASGIPTVGVPGDHLAFKITHPHDLELARLLVARATPSPATLAPTPATPAKGDWP